MCLTLLPPACPVLSCVQNNELVELLQSRVRELEADTEAGKQELMAAAARLQEQEDALL
jgi:hypothetical protein